MTQPSSIDGVLVQRGARLFYPRNRIVKTATPAHLSGGVRQRAAVIRSRIEATVRRAPEMMVKVTGGGRGMASQPTSARAIVPSGSRVACPLEAMGLSRTPSRALHGSSAGKNHGVSPQKSGLPRAWKTRAQVV
jgi:hypothetical protein